ncbi:glucan 1,4-alpha-glucosidase [Haloarchaeobius baliensis]|uniref:glucan 1,4-alpha-glucosidase n=1 Tax=Haloarchaeobius baliensis TaxID=1670458 RepID=UPI003F8815E4
MNLRASILDYRRSRDRPTRFPGERRTTDGRFSGIDGRLVYVGRDGRLADFSAPLSTLGGLARARFGLRVDGETRWLDAFDASEQRYDEHTALVETTFDDGDVRLHRHDLTVGTGHVTHVDAEGPADALVCYASFVPDGRETQVGQLVHRGRDVVEAYHRTEHDFLAADTGFDRVEGRRPADFDELLAEHAPAVPEVGDDEPYESGQLGGNVLVVVPLVDGEATVASLLTDGEIERETAIDRVTALATEHDADGLASIARDQLAAPTTGHPETVAADLRALRLLTAPGGGRVAGPDFDPNYANSGGYGYTWFRDDAEIARYLLEADDGLDLGLDADHHRSARFYLDTQLEDGSWPHRVWPSDGSLAPGWANAPIEGGGDDYQADQTASVVAFLAAYRRQLADESLATADAPAIDALDDALAAGVASLDDWLGDDGLPVACQNAWEDMTGRFTHTAATYLQAYASVARAPVGDLANRAERRTRDVFDGLDALWSHEREAYGLRLVDGELDARFDSSSFALVEAHRAAADIGVVTDDRLDRLASHTDNTLAGLSRRTDEVYGLVRYEGDDWRAREQDDPKVWTVATAWGAHAAAELAALFDAADRAGGERFLSTSTALLAELTPGGSLCTAGGYLPEQVFDDGTPDSATPLGWPHAIRLAAAAREDVRPVPTAVGEDD